MVLSVTAVKTNETQHWIFLRGLARESGHWGDFLHRFERAMPGTTVEALDLPGTGERFAETSPLELSDYVEALRAGRPRKKVNLFALSLGAMVGLEWMRLHPEEVDRAVLVNTSLKTINPVLRRLSPSAYAQVLGIFLDANLRSREERILKLTSARTDWDAAEIDVRAQLQERHPVSRKNALRQILSATRSSEIGVRPEQPVLLLNSLGDRLVHPDCSRLISERWKAPLRRHAWAGHDLPLDDPDWTIRCVAEWLDRHPNEILTKDPVDNRG